MTGFTLNSFAEWVVQDKTPTQRVLLTLVHFGIGAWGTFAVITWGWFCFLLFRAFAFPWRWTLLVSVINGAVTARGLWIVRRKKRVQFAAGTGATP